MRLAMIGLGRMGLNMVRRLVLGGHEIIASNRSPGPVQEAAAAGAIPASSLADAISKLSAPRVVWLMLPAGDVTENHIHQTMDLIGAGRHHRRRRQQQLQGHDAPRRDGQGARHRVRRRGHQRRRLGPGPKATA